MSEERATYERALGAKCEGAAAHFFARSSAATERSAISSFGRIECRISAMSSDSGSSCSSKLSNNSNSELSASPDKSSKSDTSTSSEEASDSEEDDDPGNLPQPRGPECKYYEKIGSIFWGIDESTLAEKMQQSALGKRTYSETLFDPTRLTGWHDLVHPKIYALVYPLKRLLLSKYESHDSKCAIRVGELLQMENKTIAEHCPKCEVSDELDQKGLCWNFICGRCERGKKCKGVHVRPDRLPESVVTELVTLLMRPIVKKMKEVKRLPSIKRARTGEAKVTFG